MTVIGRRTTRAQAGGGVGSYLVVGVVALAIGMAAAYGLLRIGETRGEIEAHPTATEGSALVTANLSGLWESGLAQQHAMASAGAFRNARTTRGRKMSNHLDALIVSGLAQQAAIKDG